MPVYPAARFRAPSTSSMLLSIYIDLCRVEKTKNQKEAGIGPFKKKMCPPSTGLGRPDLVVLAEVTASET